MAETAAKLEREVVARPEVEELLTEPADEKAARERTVARLRLLWEQRRFLFRVTALGLVAATAIAFLIPRHYTSSARLMPPDQISGAGAMLAAAAGRTGRGQVGGVEDFLRLKATGDLFIGILQSDTVEDDLVRKFGLQKEYHAAYLADVRKALAQRTNISQDRKSGIITIQVTDHNPQRAAAMAEEYVDELNQVVSHLTTSSAHRERVFLEERLVQVKQQLETAEKDFSQFASQNTAIDIKEQGKAMVEAAATLQGQLIAAQSELQGFKQIYTDNNVRVRSIRARIGELQRQLDKLGGAGENPDSSDPPGQTSLYPSIRKLPLLGVAYADLYRRTKVQEAVFEILTQEYEIAKVQEAKEIPSVKVLDPPTIPERKSFPPRLLIMFLGTFLAFTGGIAWVLSRAVWEATDTSDPRKAFATEVWSDVREALPWASPNGSRMGRPVGWLRRRIRQSKNIEAGEVKQHEEHE